MQRHELRTVCAMLLAAGPVLAAPGIRVTVSNPGTEDWPQAPVIIPADPAWAGSVKASRTDPWVAESDHLIALQQDDLDGDGQLDELCFVTSLGAGTSRQFTLKRQMTCAPASRAHARMSIKGYDGVGWESDRIAYRIYWNLDNAMDVFGKSRPILSLDYWAKPGVRHDMESEYGIDVLKVNRALGIGGFGIWRDGRIEKVTNVMKDYHIRADGPYRAVVDLEYAHWIVGQRDPDAPLPPGTKPATYDMIVRLGIFAGQKWGQAEVTLKPGPKSPLPELVTGIPVHEETELVRDKEKGIMGRWGRQAPGDREVPRSADLGMGVIINPKDAIEYGADGVNEYVRLRLSQGRVTYRYHASWGKEPDGAHSAKEYEAMLRRVASLRPAVKVEIVKD